MESRVVAIVLFAAAAVGVGVGRSTHRDWLVAGAFGLFAVGVGFFFRWRGAEDARVLDREEKTSDEDDHE